MANEDTLKKISGFTGNIGNAATNFDTLVADSTQSIVDLPSTYPLNSERFRLVTEGTVTEADNFTDGDGSFKLSINGDASDAIELRSRQRVTYIPNYELLWGIAYFMSTPLESGQRLEVAFTDDTRDNGYFVRLDPDERTAFIKNGGTIVDQKVWGTNGSASDPYERDTLDETIPQVVRTYLSWYGDGNAQFTLTSSGNGGGLKNETIAEVANRQNVATGEINLKLTIRLEATAATTATTLNALSMGALVQGSGSITNRVKSNVEINLAVDTTGFTPLVAVRRRADRNNVVTQLTEFKGIPTQDMEIIAVAFPDGSTDASGFDVPPEQDSENTATERTTSITTFPTDADGNPDGRLVGTLLAVAGQGATRTPTGDSVFEAFYDDETLVFLGRTTADTTADVDLVYKTRQEW